MRSIYLDGVVRRMTIDISFPVFDNFRAETFGGPEHLEKPYLVKGTLFPQKKIV